MGKTSLRAPRRALLRIPPCKRARSTKSSASERVPFNPSKSLSLNVAGSYRPSSSRISVLLQRTNFEQMMPIAGIACEPGDFQAQHQSNLPEPNLGHQPLKTEAVCC